MCGRIAMIERAEVTPRRAARLAAMPVIVENHCRRDADERGAERDLKGASERVHLSLLRLWVATAIRSPGL